MTLGAVSIPLCPWAPLCPHLPRASLVLATAARVGITTLYPWQRLVRMVRVHSVGEVRDEEKEDQETATAKGVSPVRQTLNFSLLQT